MPLLSILIKVLLAAKKLMIALQNDSKAYLLLSLKVLAIECNITHISLAKLLCILKKLHPCIPKDPQTLL